MERRKASSAKKEKQAGAASGDGSLRWHYPDQVRWV
jgi:hypothetical protein